jgi:hypothetical protein
MVITNQQTTKVIVTNSIFSAFLFDQLQRYIVDSRNSESFTVSKTRWAVRSFFLVIQMGQIMRYIDSLYFGVKYMKHPDVKYYQFMVNEDTDATMLRLFECFMESAPQLLIQLYIIMQTPAKLDRSNSTDFIFYGNFDSFRLIGRFVS